jgi:hypothetical protein
MYRPVMRPISIRLPAPDIAMAQQLARKKGIPYQTYIKVLLHEALEREFGAPRHAECNEATLARETDRPVFEGSTNLPGKCPAAKSGLAQNG